MDTDTARLLGEAAERWAAEHYDLPLRARWLQCAGGFDMPTWRSYAELGWLALRVPEAEGGLDADALAVGTLMEIVGSRLLLEPILASAIVGTGLLVRLASPAQRERWLPALVSGRAALAFADAQAGCVWHAGILRGQARAVLHGDVADAVIVAALDAATQRPVLCLVETGTKGSPRRQAYRLVDGRGAANFEFDGLTAEVLAVEGEAAAALGTALAEATVAQCAEALGCVRALLAATREHLSLRQQFGRPLGANQVLQHRAVEMFILQEEIAAFTARAQEALALPAAERDTIVAAAKAYVCRAARHVANDAVQLHGGVGITEELAVSHHFRRLMVNAALFGDRDTQFARFLSGAEGGSR
jgi:alkylation response protein AidB-like acyl-CoA dehydrogenase